MCQPARTSAHASAPSSSLRTLPASLALAPRPRSHPHHQLDMHVVPNTRPAAPTQSRTPPSVPPAQPCPAPCSRCPPPHITPSRRLTCARYGAAPRTTPTHGHRTTPAQGQRTQSPYPHAPTQPTFAPTCDGAPALCSTREPAPRPRPPSRSSAPWLCHARPLKQFRSPPARTPTQSRASPMPPLPPRITSSTCAYWYSTSAPPTQPCQAPSSRGPRSRRGAGRSPRRPHGGPRCHAPRGKCTGFIRRPEHAPVPDCLICRDRGYFPQYSSYFGLFCSQSNTNNFPTFKIVISPQHTQQIEYDINV